MDDGKNEKPQYLNSADFVASERGVDGRELLRLIRRTALTPNYPTAECFLPHEMFEYEQTGQISNNRLAHQDQCPNCHALLTALRPDERFTSELRDAVYQYRSSPPQAELVNADAEVIVSRGTRVARVSAWATAAVVLCSCALYFGVGKSHPNRIADQAASITNNPAQMEKLVFVNESGKKQMVVDVEGIGDKRISFNSYPTAAAAMALVDEPRLLRSTNTKGGLEEGTIQSGDLSYKVVLALASTCEKGPLISFASKDLTTLKHALRDQQIEVAQVSQIPSKSTALVVSFHGDSATLEPVRALLSTQRYCNLLHQSAGDVVALENSAKNVQIRVASIQ